MSIDLNNSPEEIINQLSPTEIQILYILGKLDISVKKNINEDTIKKKLPDNHLKKFPKSLNNLKKSGLIVRYRNNNWAVSKKGREVTHLIVKQKREKYYKNLSRILLFVD